MEARPTNRFLPSHLILIEKFRAFELYMIMLLLAFKWFLIHASQRVRAYNRIVTQLLGHNESEVFFFFVYERGCTLA